jgi:HEAT repeat-containing protein 5
VKNNLLAGVLILTVAPPTAKVGLAAIEHCCFLITQKLLDLEEVFLRHYPTLLNKLKRLIQMTLTAAQCARTLVVASTSGNQALRQCTKLLLPGLIEFVAKVSPSVIDGSVSEHHSAALSEVWKAFSAFLTSVPEDHSRQFL